MKGFFEVRYMSNNFSILTNNNKKKIGKENSGVSISQKKQKKQRKRHPICSFIEKGKFSIFVPEKSGKVVRVQAPVIASDGSDRTEAQNTERADQGKTASQEQSTWSSAIR